MQLLHWILAERPPAVRCTSNDCYNSVLYEHGVVSQAVAAARPQGTTSASSPRDFYLPVDTICSCGPPLVPRCNPATSHGSSGRFRRPTVGKNCTKQPQRLQQLYNNLQLQVQREMPVATPVGQDGRQPRSVPIFLQRVMPQSGHPIEVISAYRRPP